MTTSMTPPQVRESIAGTHPGQTRPVAPGLKYVARAPPPPSRGRSKCSISSFMDGAIGVPPVLVFAQSSVQRRLTAPLPPNSCYEPAHCAFPGSATALESHAVRDADPSAQSSTNIDCADDW